MEGTTKEAYVSISDNLQHAAFFLSRVGLGGWLALGPLLFLSCWTLVYLYRISFHPLAKFPGPKLAGASFWYQFYYDVYPHDGQYTFKIKELHKQYGPIIRINPRYIHIDDPDYYNEIYSGGRGSERCEYWYATAKSNRPAAGSMLFALDYDLHKQRRSAVGSLFSRGGVKKLQYIIDERVMYAMNRLHQDYINGTIVNLSDLNSGLTLDVVSAYCFGDAVRALEEPEYGRIWRLMLLEGTSMNLVPRGLHWLMTRLRPLPFASQQGPNAKKGVEPYKEWMGSLIGVINDILAGQHAASNQAKHTTIFHEIRDSDLLSEEKTTTRLWGEAFIMIGAGTETTARTLSTLHYYLLSDPAIYERLLQELRQVMPKVDSHITVEQAQHMPFFTACVNEALRLAHGVPTRTPRVALDDLHYKEWIIPRRTPVMQSSYLMHLNPDIWHNPFKFEPQRWIDNPKLTKYLVPFLRGTFDCVGQNLAWAELYTMTAHLFRRYEMELYKTIEERDVRIKHDCNLGIVDRNSPGIRVKIVGEHKE